MFQQDHGNRGAFVSHADTSLRIDNVSEPELTDNGMMPFNAPKRLKVRIPGEGTDLVATPSNLQALSFLFAQTRSPQLRDVLILYHQKMVHYVAFRFLGSGETLEDLIQVGNIGLIQALDRFDPSRDVKFSTYAMPTIVGEIKRHFRDKTWHVKVPRWLQELSLHARKAQQILSIRLGRPPTVREIAAELNTTEDETLEALEISKIANTISLDMRLETDYGADSATLMDVIGRIDSAMHDIDAYADLRRALDLLDPREREVVHLRFFEELSQAKIAHNLGLTQMQVSRLQQRALQRLRGILAGAFAGLPSSR